MRVLVTGGAGFIGSHLCRRCVADGHDVIAFDDLSEGAANNLADVPEVRLVVGDIRDEAAVRSAARGCSIIHHHAAVRSVPRSIAQPAVTTDVNVRGTLNVLMAANDVGATVVFASSSSVYGDQPSYPQREDLRPMPRSPYAASKLAGEAYCRAWWRSYGVATVALRYFNVYGPRQDPASEYAAVIPRFIAACRTDTPAEIHGDGTQTRDFTYIDDVVEANIQAATSADAIGSVLNVGGGRTPTSIRELFDLIAREVGSSSTPHHTPAREGDVRRSEADVSLAERLISYRPAVDIREGVRRTVEWFTHASPTAASPEAASADRHPR